MRLITSVDPGIETNSVLFDLRSGSVSGEDSRMSIPTHVFACERCIPLYVLTGAGSWPKSGRTLQGFRCQQASGTPSAPGGTSDGHGEDVLIDQFPFEPIIVR